MQWNKITGRFINSRGDMGIQTTQTKSGRYQYRTDTGTLVASGMQPHEFAARYWHASNLDYVEGK